EMAHDYRYFPEPDLQPIYITQEYIDNVESNLPSLPGELFEKYTKQFQLSDYDAGVLTDDKSTAAFFESLISTVTNYKTAANWVMGPIRSYLNQQAISIEEFPLKPNQIADIINAIESGKISNSVATQKVFPAMIESNTKSAIEIAESNNWIQETDEDEIVNIVRDTINNFPAQLEKYKKGNVGLVGFFMGEVMKETKGKADPKTANQLVRKILDES